MQAAGRSAPGGAHGFPVGPWRGPWCAPRGEYLGKVKTGQAVDCAALSRDTGAMSEVFIFGYGSLVNRRTHDYAKAHRASLRGWRRAWRHTSRREVAFLNAVPEPGHEMKGLVLAVPRVAPDLDRREQAYSRCDVSGQVSPPPEGAAEVSLFAIPPDSGGGRAGHVLLLSYIDVVAQGYLREYGEGGVRDFFETTDGWDAPVIDDRAAPRYPRAQPADDGLTALVDHWLGEVGARRAT